MCWYLIVALHSVDECLISHNLCVSVEEGLETVLGLPKLLLGYLWEQGQTEDMSVLKPYRNVLKQADNSLFNLQLKQNIFVSIFDQPILCKQSRKNILFPGCFSKLLGNTKHSQATLGHLFPVAFQMFL